MAKRWIRSTTSASWLGHWCELEYNNSVTSSFPKYLLVWLGWYGIVLIYRQLDKHSSKRTSWCIHNIDSMIFGIYSLTYMYSWVYIRFRYFQRDLIGWLIGVECRFQQFFIHNTAASLHTHMFPGFLTPVLHTSYFPSNWLLFHIDC